ncbi:hypothetical protein F5B20DRAFT_567083 [Whalleya microplaca]|nr:hypothetical protein F5B20DRAFT_567083 [Whalleya microplaca]
MIAVVGAIIAQVAITSLSLRGMDQAQWTASQSLLPVSYSGPYPSTFALLFSRSSMACWGPDVFSDWLSRPLTKQESSTKRMLGLITLPSYPNNLPLEVQQHRPKNSINFLNMALAAYP